MRTACIKSIILLCVTGLSFTPAPAQSTPEKADTSSLLRAFRKGSIHGHFRQFSMFTDNAAGLSDYHAIAIGGGIKYETRPWYNFSFGVSGFFIYNLHSADLGEADPSSGAHNRYEIGLFDIEDPYNKSNIDRLEELYLKYSFAGNQLIFGKQIINTPFINAQDSRMRPSEAEGFYGRFSISAHTSLETGFLYRFSPRSTVDWYNTGGSIGIYPQGVNRNGSTGNYRNNLRSAGVALAGIHFRPSPAFHAQLWEYVAENMFHTTMLQADIKQGYWLGALQYIRQDALRDGGNPDPAKTYFAPGNTVNILGLRAGWEDEKTQLTLNYTRITKSGRFTMPREWGTEPLFTYLSRERNEGYGDVHAASALLKMKHPCCHARSEFGYGHYYMPDVQDHALSKYGVPSYYHVKALADYAFGQSLEGMDLAFLFVYKGHLGTPPTDKKYLINKIDMASWNLILNYHF
ncbi:hypothetical protein [Chitinophaga sp. XS-30]|uniref:hypothetical protein n=1 Tax=Chitinophaga sp. XS-30 TaxID=2604421 RepID=UPI0011DDEDF7|nr:hypothetical protein [Chitinophaga sp. XS-30]QEH41460.1 hypothetical protein FW415_11425 [Chitinophaga sp. XS-30]